MAVDEISVKIGNAWDMHNKGDNAGAVKAFEALIAQSSIEVMAQVDALYGYGLAKRAGGDRPSAKESFIRAKNLAENTLAEMRAARSSSELSTPKEDRYMMLLHMIQQRINEVSL